MGYLICIVTFSSTLEYDYGELLLCPAFPLHFCLLWEHAAWCMISASVSLSLHQLPGWKNTGQIHINDRIKWLMCLCLFVCRGLRLCYQFGHWLDVGFTSCLFISPDIHQHVQETAGPPVIILSILLPSPPTFTLYYTPKAGIRSEWVCLPK